MRDGVIRTPMPPMDTFQDDPLRVLRCIRFASRFGFEVVTEIKEATKDQTIQVRFLLLLLLPPIERKLESIGRQSRSRKGR